MSMKTKGAAIALTCAFLAPGTVAFASPAACPSALADLSATTTVTSIQTANKTMYTNVDAVVRSGPGTSYAKVKTLPKGTKVTVTQTKNGWSKVTVGGWIRSDLLSSTKPGSTLNNTGSKTMYTSVSAVVRSGPGTSYAKVKTLAKGTKVTVTQTKSGWSKVSGGWIRSDLLTSKNSGSGSSSDSSMSGCTPTTAEKRAWSTGSNTSSIRVCAMRWFEVNCGFDASLCAP